MDQPTRRPGDRRSLPGRRHDLEGHAAESYRHDQALLPADSPWEHGVRTSPPFGSHELYGRRLLPGADADSFFGVSDIARANRGADEERGLRHGALVGASFVLCGRLQFLHARPTLFTERIWPAGRPEARMRISGGAFPGADARRNGHGRESADLAAAYPRHLGNGRGSSRVARRRRAGGRPRILRICPFGPAFLAWRLRGVADPPTPDCGLHRGKAARGSGERIEPRQEGNSPLALSSRPSVSKTSWSSGSSPSSVPSGCRPNNMPPSPRA